MILSEAFDYEFSRFDPTGDHIDPPTVAVYEGLMVKGPDWQPKPGLAESWKISDDGLEWRVKLRPNARFHSGAVCDAEAAVAALLHLRYFFPLTQLWYWDPVDTLVADGDDTLVFTLHHPYVRLPSLLWGTHTTVFNEALRAEKPDEFGFEIVDGTGPFRCTSWSPDRVTAEPNPDYPGTPSGVEAIEWLSILAEEERLAALERGDVHVLHGPPLAEVDELKADSRYEVVEFTQASNLYLALNWQRTDLGFDKLKLRQAISLGIDRNEIVADALAGHGVATYGPIGPCDEFYDREVDRRGRHDREEAAKIVAELTGGQPLAFECVVQDDAVIRRMAEVVRRQLAELGVHLEYRYEKPFAPFYEAIDASPASFISKWLWQDAVDALIGFTSSRYDGCANWQHAAVPELDTAFDTWLRAQTRDELAAAASDVQRIAATELPYIPLVTPNDVWVYTKRLRGFQPYQADLYPRYEEATLDAED